MQIRIATESDLTELVSVQQEVHELHTRAFPNYYRAASDRELRAAMIECLAADNTRVWIAVMDDCVAGFLVFKLETVPENAYCFARRKGVIDQMGVAARFQRQGIGRALMEEAAAHAAREQCSELRLGVLALNTAARKFYESVGFSEFQLQLRKDL